MSARVAIVVFPGTNCELDAAYALEQLGGEAELVFHTETSRSVLTAGVAPGTILRLPINHFEGNYTCDAATLDRLRADDRIVLRYVDNPNGSMDDIAGICNEHGNVVGLMPHPERASDDVLGSSDGVVLLQSLLDAAVAGTAAA